MIVATDKNLTLNRSSAVDMIFGLTGTNMLNGGRATGCCTANGNDTQYGGGGYVLDGARAPISCAGRLVTTG